MADERGRAGSPSEVRRVTMDLPDPTLKRSRLDSTLKTNTTPTDWLNDGGKSGGQSSPQPAPDTSKGRQSDGR